MLHLLLALMLSGQGQSAVIGPVQPIVAILGDDIILPCYLDPTTDASDMTVEWNRPDLESRLVHVWPERPELLNPSYKGRTSLFINELQHGEISLKISKVKLSDEGTYRCFVPDLQRDAAVRLVVGAASSPAIKINRTSSRVVLQCESAGWYPQPELLWLDGERNLLPAGPTETLRGPDGLYTVSSRVTVEKRHSNNLTCRVQQKNINQHRETHIHVPDDVFMVISPSSPPTDPTIDPNTIIGLVIGAVVVLLLIPAVFCVVWKRRRDECRNRKKSEEEGPEQTRKKTMRESENDNRGFRAVVEEGESEPLMAGKEEEDDVDSRGEKRHKEEREAKQDEFVLEQTKDNPQEKRINPSVVTDKKSLITIEKERQDVTVREEEDDVDSRGEKNFKEERETQQDETETEQRRDANRPETNTSAMTEKESQVKMKQETHEEQNKTGRREINDVESRGEQSNKDDRKRADHHVTEAELKGGLRRSEEETMNQFILTEKVSQSTASHLNTDQEPWRENKKQQEQTESDVIRKKSDTEKKRSEENRSVVNKLYSMFKAPKKTQEHQREKLLAVQLREKNQRKNQSETRMAREKDETELKIIKYKNQHHKEEKTQERSEKESENEKDGEGNQRESLGMTERKTEEQRGQEESRNSSVSSKVTLNTDLNIQDKRGQNQEKQPEEKSDQSREETREQPEEQRRAQRREENQREMMGINEGVKPDGTNRKEREKLQLTHKGALQVEQQVNINQKEELEEPVSLTERGVDCVEEPQKLVDKSPDVDQHNIQSRKHMQEIKLHEVCKQSVKKENIQDARKHQNVRKVKKFVRKQNDVCIEVNDAAHSQHAAITQQHETIKWPKEQQMLSEQKEPQEYLTEHDEDLTAVEEHSGLQFPPFTEEPMEQQPVLLAEAKTFNMINDQDMMEVEEHSGLQFPPFTEEPMEQQPVLLAEAKTFNMINDQGMTEIEEHLTSDQSREETREQQPVLLAEANTFNVPSHLNTDQDQLRENEKQQEQFVEKRQTESDVIRKNSDETELQISKYKNQHHKEGKTQERSEKEPENEKHGEENQRESLGMTERKTEEQRRAQSEEDQREMMGINEVVTPDGTNRKEGEKLQLTHEGALQVEQQVNINQKEELEEPVSLTERGVDCVEEPQKLVDESPDVDQHNIQSRKHIQEIKLHEVCNLPAKKQKIQEEERARKHQKVRKVKKFVKKQNLEVDDAAHSQHAAITQQHETIKWPKEQQMLSEQKEPQEYLTEHDEDLMEVDEHSGLQFPPFTEEPREQQPVLLAEAKTFNMINDQDMMEVEEH